MTDAHAAATNTWRSLVAAVVLTAAASLPVINVYGVAAGLRLIIGSAIAAVVVAQVVPMLLRRSDAVTRWLAALLGLIVGTALPIMLADADPFGSQALRQTLLVSPGSVWRRILSVQLVVPCTHTFVDAAGMYLGAATLLATAATRTRFPALAPAIGACLFGGLLALGVHGPENSFVLAVPFCLAVGIYLFLTVSRSGTGVNPLVFAFAITAFAGGLVIANAVVLRAPVDPRHAVQNPPSDVQQNSPLAELSARLQQPHSTAFVAKLVGSGGQEPRNWLETTYDSYTGDGWTTSIDATAISDAAPGVTPSKAEVTMQQPTELLPHQGTVLSLGPGGGRLDLKSDTLVAATPTLQYTVGFRSDQLSVAALSSAGVPAVVSDRLRKVPSCSSDQLHTFAANAVSGAFLPDEQAVKLLQAFKAAPFTFDPSAAPGDGCARITDFLTSHRGTSEQFATAYALAARTLGLPARLAVGFGPGSPIGDNRFLVTDADARAWVQIELTGVGWVDFEPTPAGQGAYTRPSAKQPALSKIQQAIANGATKPTSQQPPQPPPTGGTSYLWILWLALALIGVLIAIPPAVRIIRRSRRRRAPDERRRLLNAWAEALTALRHAGVHIDNHTAPQIADRGRAVAGSAAEALAELAFLAERAVYSHAESGDAGRGWALAVNVRRAVAGGSPRWRRAVRAFTALS